MPEGFDIFRAISSSSEDGAEDSEEESESAILDQRKDDTRCGRKGGRETGIQGVRIIRTESEVRPKFDTAQRRPTEQQPQQAVCGRAKE